MTYEPTEQSFLDDVKRHVMEIELNNGIFRSLTFGADGTINKSFRIVTWPGHLCISGDMGTYVFSRLRDMFEFFRGNSINPGYWSEKVMAQDRNSPVMKFCEEKFRNAVYSYLGASEADKEYLEEHFFPYVMDSNNEHCVMNEVMSWQDPREDEDIAEFEFSDFFEYRITDYSYHYIWCLHAIVWAIGQFDNHNTSNEENF